jgi:hypothetical protein
MGKNRRVVFIQRVTACHQAGTALAPRTYNAVRKEAIVAGEQNNVTGDHLVQFLPLNFQDIARQNTRKHATSCNPNVHAAKRSQDIRNQLTTHSVARSGAFQHPRACQDCLRFSPHPDCVEVILPQLRADVSNTRSERKAGLL